MSRPSKTVTSAANPAVKRLRALDLKKYRDEEGLFLVEGPRYVADALAGGFTLEILAGTPRGLEKAGGAAAKAKETLEVTDEILGKITGKDNNQPLVGAFRQKWHPLDEVRKGLWVGLEGIRDPGNLGNIMRSADAVKAEGVLLIGDTCDPWSPPAIRASVGSFARVPVVRATAKEFLAWRAGWRGRVIGTHLKAAADYRHEDYKLPLLLLMGTEQSGLSDTLADACDARVKIPMPGGAESLNLAVSAGIMLYEICRGRL